MEFDEAHWSRVIQKPDWYLEFNEFATRAKEELEPESEQANQLNKKARHFFEAALEKGQVFLSKDGPDLDKERQPVDTVVIHHTSAQPGYRLSYLNAVHLLNIYVPYFTNPTVRSEENLRGQPIWSGHFHEGQQVFWGYHWLMRMDGKFIRLLEDDQIGWHAGNWGINTRSIAICLDNDYENQDPTDETLQSLAAFIKKNYPQARLIGHREVRPGTICPGTSFLSNWKTKLINCLS